MRWSKISRSTQAGSAISTVCATNFDKSGAEIQGRQVMPNCNPAPYVYASKAGTPMQDASGYDPKYVMGRSTAETDRLGRQSQLYDASTWQLFKEAGFSEYLIQQLGGAGALDVGFLRQGRQIRGTLELIVF